MPTTQTSALATVLARLVARWNDGGLPPYDFRRMGAVATVLARREGTTRQDVFARYGARGLA